MTTASKQHYRFRLIEQEACQKIRELQEKYDGTDMSFKDMTFEAYAIWKSAGEEQRRLEIELQSLEVQK